MCTPKVPTHTRAMPNIGRHLRDLTSLWTLTGMRDNTPSRRRRFPRSTRLGPTQEAVLCHDPQEAFSEAD